MLTNWVRRFAVKLNSSTYAFVFAYRNDQLIGQFVEAVGWGTTSFGGKPSTALRKASLSVISYAQCQQYYGNKIAYSHLCTLTPSRDACQVRNLRYFLGFRLTKKSSFISNRWTPEDLCSCNLVA